VAVKIRLKRMGKIRAPFYRVVVMDSRTKRDGRAIEEIGKYHPTEEPSLIQIDVERANHWIANGAQPTEAVAALLKLYAEGKVRTAEPKPSKKDLYEAALTAAGKSTAEDTSGATTAKKKAAKKDEAPAAEATEAATLVDATPDSQESVVAAEEAAGEPAKETPEGAIAANADGSSPDAEYVVKGNADSRKYHEADGQWYDQTVAEFWFKSAADAEAAGFVKAGA
jgi:small subunit ribosomal protein S16